MALNSSDLSGGEDGHIDQYNDLRQDVREANCDTLTRYLSISPADLAPLDNGSVWHIDYRKAQSNSDTAAVTVQHGLQLPHGAIITSLKVYWYRDDSNAAGIASLYRVNFQENSNAMASANSDATSGYHSVENTTISNATVDDLNYTYALLLFIDPNNNKLDVRFNGAVITYTIVLSLP